MCHITIQSCMNHSERDTTIMCCVYGVHLVKNWSMSHCHLLPQDESLARSMELSQTQVFRFLMVVIVLVRKLDPWQYPCFFLVVMSHHINCKKKKPRNMFLSCHNSMMKNIKSWNLPWYIMGPLLLVQCITVWNSSPYKVWSESDCCCPPSCSSYNIRRSFDKLGDCQTLFQCSYFSVHVHDVNFLWN